LVTTDDSEVVIVVRVQLPTSAVNVTPLAFAADRRAAVAGGSKGGRACCRRAVQQSIDVACPLGPQQQTCRTLQQRANGTD